MYLSRRFLRRRQHDLMRVMYQTVAYRVRKSGVSYYIVPCFYGELAGDYDGAYPVEGLRAMKVISANVVPIGSTNRRKIMV